MFPSYGTLLSASAAPHCGVISGLKETFIKRYIVERINEAEKDQKNRVRKWRVVGGIYGMKYS